MPHHDTYIAGHRFRDGATALLESLDQDAALDLEPDPANEHDPNAVKVLYQGQFVGFVPRDLAAEVGELIRAGRITAVTKRTGTSGIQIAYEEPPPDAA